MARAAVGVDLLDSGVQIAVFTDYQCPFCRRLDSVLNVLSQQHRGKLSRSVIHFPLSEHPHARRAAQAMECASVQGRGREVHGQLYANQNRIGDLASSQLAAAAAIPDSDGFAACVAADSTFSRIDAGLALGDRLKVSGTPVALVNGWLLDPATPSSVAAAVEALINGKTPKKKGV
jgi:protein-disulfide isomerase